MKKRAIEHKKLVSCEKSMKASKKGCQRLGENYKESPYCLGLHNNYAEKLYPDLKWVKKRGR